MSVTDSELWQLGHRAARCLDDDSQLTQLRQLTGGTSSLTYLATRLHPQGAESQVVIKVAPAGLEPVRNRDVLRQARILRTLSGTDVLVPCVLGEDAGSPPEVPPLFVMEFVAGESYEPMQRDDQGRSSATDREVSERALAAVRMLVALHHLDSATLAVANEPVVAPADELRRWHRAFTTTDGDLHPRVVDQAYDLLAAETPLPLPPVVSHGDWRLGNMQCQGSEIRAVIDWEIWSLGDPRLDLSWLLLMADPVRLGAVRHGGMPGPAELLAAYEALAGRQLEGMTWFAALVRFKQAAASALICKNTRKAPIPTDRGLAMAELVPSLASRAVELLSSRR